MAKGRIIIGADIGLGDDFQVTQVYRIVHEKGKINTYLIEESILPQKHLNVTERLFQYSNQLYKLQNKYQVSDEHVLETQYEEYMRYKDYRNKLNKKDKLISYNIESLITNPINRKP